MNAETLRPDDGAPGKQRRSALWPLAFRVAVTIALMGWVLWILDLASFASRLSSLSAGWVGLAFLVVLAAVALSAWKWGMILRWRGFVLPFGRLLRHYFVGLFFNNLLPSTIGGDAVRAWETARDTRDVPEAVGSVVTERLIAGAGLGLTAMLGLPFVAGANHMVPLVVLFLVIDLALVALFLVPRVAEGIVTNLLPFGLSSLGDAVLRTVGAIRASVMEPRLVLRVIVLSILFQILVAAVNACIFRAMAVPVSLAECIILTPMIFTITMLPVSLSGMGVREAAYMYFFAQVGVAPTEAVLASLAFFPIVAVASLPGAPLFFFNLPSPFPVSWRAGGADANQGTPMSHLASSRFRPASLAALLDFPREVFKRGINLLRGVSDISPVRAQQVIAEQGAAVVDVREAQEYAAGHVPGSRLIPLGDIAARANELGPYRDAPLVIICHGGKRSATACVVLARLGFTRTFNVAGGMLAWRRAGLPEAR